ncbi:hypothetical protein P5V15_008417 [Pogonomyrmex californicus]
MYSLESPRPVLQKDDGPILSMDAGRTAAATPSNAIGKYTNNFPGVRQERLHQAWLEIPNKKGRIGVQRISSSIDGHANMVATVRENCLRFYITAAEEISKRLPVSDIFLSKLQIFLPHIALLSTNRETSFHEFSFIVARMSGFDENGLKKEWFALNSNFSVTEKQNCTN